MNVNSSANSYFDIALAKPTITERCRELTKLIDECNTKLLHNNFVSIIHHIFGVNHNGWGILTANPRHQASDCQVLKEFLGCHGPMFRLLQKLQLESMLFRYDFPCSMLPPSFMFNTNETPFHQSRLFQQFYTGLHSSDSQYSTVGSPNTTTGQTCIRVTAFEFYFYHFAYCIVKPPSYRPTLQYVTYHQLPPTVEENLYYLLVDEYLAYYLPIDGSGLPGVLSTSANSPVGISQFPLHASVSTLLIKSPKQSTNLGATRTDMWRSDLVVRIFVEFWLGQWLLRRGEQKNLIPPSEDLMRAVRRLVKHIHYFINTNNTSLTHSHSHFNDTSIEIFKQNILINCLQPRLFTFLCYCFKVWPLNSTFRVVLETWLSYIQPWRYTDPSNAAKNIEMRLSSDREIANVWYQFVSGNLQFYNRLFYDAINRFVRMDISKQSNSLLLYRVSKIFSQPNLIYMIGEAEIALYGDKQYHHLQAHGSYIALNRPETLSTMNPPPYLIRSDELRQMVNQLLTVCSQALGTVKKFTQPKSVDMPTQILGIIGLGALTEMGTETLLNANWKKSEQQIQDSMILLADLFDLTLPESDNAVVDNNQIENPFGPEAPECSFDYSGMACVTELGRFEMMNNLKKFPIFPNTGPDLQPIRSFENRFLVRILYKLSSAINSANADRFRSLCNQQNLIGTWSRSFLYPTYDSRPAVLLKEWQNLPPRISLRVFAHYRTIFYIVLYFLVCRFLGVSFLQGFVYIVLIFFLLSVLNAVVKEYFTANRE